MPKISILMSVYNKGEYLGEAIRSVLAQSFTDFEFIIKDNGSTDNSVEVVARFADPRIRFSQNSRNLGPGPVTSLNNCIEAARGDYVTFAHGDDVWDREFLATNLAFLEEHGSIDFSHSLMHTIDEHGAVTPAQAVKEVGAFRIERYDEVLKRLFKGCYVKTPTALIRKRAVRFYDIRYIYTCDWDMFLNMAVARHDFLFINRPLIYYRVSSSSETAAGMKDGDLILESYLTLRNFFNKNPEYRRYRRKAFKRLSDSVLRRSRDVGDRETLYFFFCCVILCYPLQVFNPIFHCYLFLGVMFGQRGVRLLKKTSRSIKGLVRGKG